MQWFEEVFLRHKSPRKTLLILDGHSSHSNNIRLLEVARENNVILLCLPSHTTHALQPLDRAFFRPLKVYFASEAKAWMVGNKDRKLTRYDVSKLIGKAWGKAATVSNGVSALKSCGIYPFDPSAIPDHYFSLSDSLLEQNLVAQEVNGGASPRELLSKHQDHDTPVIDDIVSETSVPKSSENVDVEFQPQPGPSGITSTKSRHQDFLATVTDQSSLELISLVTKETEQIKIMETDRENEGSNVANPDLILRTPEKTNESTEPQETPSKVLSFVYPIPKLPEVLSKRKQKAIILTSDENIQKRKLLADKKKPVDKLKPIKRMTRRATTNKTTKTVKEKDGENLKQEKESKRKPNKGPLRKNKKKKASFSSSSESNDENEDITYNSEDEISNEDNNKCIECTEDYYKTKSTEDWIQCLSCSAWFHEFCTMYNPLCNYCGRKAKREAVNKQMDQ